MDNNGYYIIINETGNLPHNDNIVGRRFIQISVIDKTLCILCNMKVNALFAANIFIEKPYDKEIFSKYM